MLVLSVVQLAQRTSRVKSGTRQTEDSLDHWTSASQSFFFLPWTEQYCGCHSLSNCNRLCQCINLSIYCLKCSRTVHYDLVIAFIHFIEKMQRGWHFRGTFKWEVQLGLQRYIFPQYDTYPDTVVMIRYSCHDTIHDAIHYITTKQEGYCLVSNS